MTAPSTPSSGAPPISVESKLRLIPRNVSFANSAASLPFGRIHQAALNQAEDHGNHALGVLEQHVADEAVRRDDVRLCPPARRAPRRCR